MYTGTAKEHLLHLSERRLHVGCSPGQGSWFHALPYTHLSHLLTSFRFFLEFSHPFEYSLTVFPRVEAYGIQSGSRFRCGGLAENSMRRERAKSWKIQWEREGRGQEVDQPGGARALQRNVL